MLTPVNDPKYAVVNGQFVNRASNEPIPDDEPVFIFRARDRHAAAAISAYADTCSDEEHRSIVRVCAADFRRFAEQHPTRMKEPDTIRTA